MIGPVRMCKVLVICLCLCVQSVFGQERNTFKYLSRLPKVDLPGYYRINLAPGLTGRSRPDLSDVRLVDLKGQFVPYVKSSNLPVNNQTRFVAFPEVQGAAISDTSTTFIAQNVTNNPIDKLWLKLKNTAANRQLDITGSDDMKHWFSVAEDLTLGTPAKGDNKGFYQLPVAFPFTSFKYLKLTISNKRKSPVAILGAGVYSNGSTTPVYAEIKGVRFTKVDSPDHVTHLYLKFDLPYRIDKLSIPVVHNAYFHRQVNLYTNDTLRTWLTSTIFGNEQPDINLSVITRGLDVQIINNDDQPLPVKKIAAYQIQSFLVARLDTGKMYSILTGNPEARPPKYDLEYFADHLNGNLPDIIHQNMQHNPVYKCKTVAGGRPARGYWLWAGIIMAIVVLSALTYSMMSEINKRQKS